MLHGAVGTFPRRAAATIPGVDHAHCANFEDTHARQHEDHT